MSRPSFDLDDVLGYLVVRAAHALAGGFTELMAAEGVTVRQFGVLAHVARQDGLGSAELARRLEVTPQSMGDQVDALVRRGLLSRDPDPGPGRRIGIHLTPEGGEVLGRATEAARRYEEHLCAPLGPEGRARMMGELRTMMERATPPPAPGSHP